jgi:hypothetical protein
VLTPTTLRLRRFAAVDLRVPLAAVASVRRELVTTHEKREGELDLAVGSQTSITLELAEPVAYETFFGRRRSVRVVRLHADEASDLVRELKGALADKGLTDQCLTDRGLTDRGPDQALRPGRTAPSPLPDPLA